VSPWDYWPTHLHTRSILITTNGAISGSFMKIALAAFKCRLAVDNAPENGLLK